MFRIYEDLQDVKFPNSECGVSRWAVFMKYQPAAARILTGFCRVVASSRSCCEKATAKHRIFFVCRLSSKLLYVAPTWLTARCSGAKGFGEENLHHLA